MTKQEAKTEELIYWGVQYDSGGKTAYVFKRDHTSQDQILIVFYNRGNYFHPNRGSKMRVTYYLDPCGSYIGTHLEATDPGAYE
jgi:hypothetical protein